MKAAAEVTYVAVLALEVADAAQETLKDFSRRPETFEASLLSSLVAFGVDGTTLALQSFAEPTMQVVERSDDSQVSNSSDSSDATRSDRLKTCEIHMI